MSLYAEHILPRVLNVVMQGGETPRTRERVCAGLYGRVVEIGFGGGLNVPYYPAAVTSVCAVEPSAVSWRLAAARMAASPVPIARAGLDGQRLDLASESCDGALSTWTLCTIPDLEAALAELRRVLKPGGTFHFVEHGHAPDVSVLRWQRRLEPVNKALFGGCHLTRSIPGAIEAAGFEIDALHEYYTPKELKTTGYRFEGRAHRR